MKVAAGQEESALVFVATLEGEALHEANPMMARAIPVDPAIGNRRISTKSPRTEGALG